MRNLLGASRILCCSLGLFFLAAGWNGLAAQDSETPLRVYLRAGPKTHGPGEHDHPKFLEDWTKLLTERGALVNGSLNFPSGEELEQTDVLVFYAAEGGTLDPKQREDLDRYLKRGGGIVALHDAVCGNDAQWFKTIIGGAWEHGHSKWKIGKLGLYMDGTPHPITKGIPHFDLEDELYFDLHLDPKTQVLANSFHTVFDVTPQMWTYEPGTYRAFVSIQGHFTKTFDHPAWQAIVLRGIAWAGNRDANLFLQAAEIADLRYPPGGPKPAHEALDSFELHPDFEIACVAAEPMVVNPIAIDWDAGGRMWVASTPGYPYKEKFSGIPAHDEIQILTDRDGDGIMDEQQVFYQGLDLVTSLVRHGQGVIVTAAPEILYLEDTDGDDRADKTTVLYSGFGYGDTHAVISNLCWGPDGWVYGTQGYSGGASRDIRGAADPDKSLGAIRNGLLRFRPDGSAIEMVSSYGSNTWGLDFDPDGELFFTMANGSHARHVVLPERRLEGHRSGGVNSWKDIVDHRKVFPAAHDERMVYAQIDFVGGFTAAAGCLVQSGGAWPAEFAGNHFVCEPTVNLVHRDSLSPQGVTFNASKPRQAEFLASRDLWFRPVHLRTGPDGAMYVLDFYNQAAVHNDTRGPDHGPTNAAVRPDRDKLHGRIWRVQHKNAPANRALLPQDTAGLIASLGHPGSWQRRTAERLLREEAGRGTTLPLWESLRESDSAAVRMRCLSLIHDLDGDPDKAVAAVAWALQDRDPAVSRRAAFLAGPLMAKSKAARSMTAPLLHLAITTEDARTRMAALLALEHGELQLAGLSQLLALAPKITEDWTRSGLMAALLSNPPVSLRALLDAEESPALDALVADLGQQIGARRDGPLTNQALIILAATEGHVPARIAALGAMDTALGQRFRAQDDPAAIAAVTQLLDQDSIPLARAALAWTERFEGTALNAAAAAFGQRLLHAAQDPEASYATCMNAIRALLPIQNLRSDAVQIAGKMLVPHAPLEVQLEVIQLLSACLDDQVGTLLASSLPGLGRQARDAAFEGIMTRTERVPALLGALEERTLRPLDLGPRLLHRLRHHPSPAIAQEAGRILDTYNTNDSVLAQLETMLPLVSVPGDPKLGATLFGEHCGVCHSFEGQGKAVGPDLTGMGAHGIEELLNIVLDPNREVDQAYVEYVAQTVNGETHTGIMVRETAEGIVLRNTGGDASVARRDLESLRSTGISLMPTGLGDLGTDVLRDIMTYLTQDSQGLQILDLELVANVNSGEYLFDDQRNEGYTFKRMGILEIEGVPYSLRDPASLPSGKNILVLKGGPDKSQASKTDYPQRVVIPVNQTLARVHILGGVAAWGHPYGTKEISPLVDMTFMFEDGSSETQVLSNGIHFADWIGHYDVPGSTFVPDLLAHGPGQVRRFTVALSETRHVQAIVLESRDVLGAPVFLAMTSDINPGKEVAPPSLPTRPTKDLSPINTWIFGGGSSHDFARWYQQEDVKFLTTPERQVQYTDDEETLWAGLETGDTLIFCTNQALAKKTQDLINRHVAQGGSLLALHPGVWFNWAEWPELHTKILGAGAFSHEALRGFDVRIESARHPAIQGVPLTFEIVDELYRVKAPADADLPIEVLARGLSRHGGDSFPCVWVPDTGAGRVLVVTLGHDGRAHQLAAFQSLMRSGLNWLEGKQ